MGVKLKIAAVLSSLFVAGLVIAQVNAPAPVPAAAAGGAAEGVAVTGATGGAAVSVPGLAIAAGAVAAAAARGGKSAVHHDKSKNSGFNPGKGDGKEGRPPADKG